MLYMFRIVSVHHQEQLYELYIAFGICRYVWLFCVYRKDFIFSSFKEGVEAPSMIWRKVSRDLNEGLFRRMSLAYLPPIDKLTFRPTACIV